ncbi:hypothetical protein PR202_gb27399 [Eleusine coracana subsp. coracana]|uniref:Uncharacterized protein n=1 Tax=Eleusine coracana subsp. coracana TaxID=191504 RepID=A0AAV5FUB4_ELECO|nr:hypothetical protein PR202_gb27399 [Eleusine coracana subsp. coracana]
MVIGEERFDLGDLGSFAFLELNDGFYTAAIQVVVNASVHASHCPSHFRAHRGQPPTGTAMAARIWQR